MNKHLMRGVLLAASIGITSISWAVNPLNTVNNGRIIQGGTYYNTPDNKTTFINRDSGGLWLKTGTTLRGLEVNANGTPNNNGGTLQLYAPGSIVRVDGNIDVSGAFNNRRDAYQGNGGKVYIDSAYLYQNGNIYANGASGGFVQANVGAMTLGPSATIQAQGSYEGAGGVVSINSKGPVDVRLGASIDTSGQTLPTFDTNIINIEGSMINLHGRLVANGVSSRGGTIRLVSTAQSNLGSVNEAIRDASGAGLGNDPTLSTTVATQLQTRLAHLSNPDLNGDVQLNASATRVSANGSFTYTGLGNDLIESPVPRGGDGGTIIVSAAQDVINYGIVAANGGNGLLGNSPQLGGNGGTIAITAQGGFADPAHPNSSGQIINTGLMTANGEQGAYNSGAVYNGKDSGGKSGDGGMVAFGYKDTLINAGRIQANGAEGGYGSIGGPGGNGGLIVFSGSNNPTGNGSVIANGGPGGREAELVSRMGQAGTIVTPSPNSPTFAQAFSQRGRVNGLILNKSLNEQTQTNELLSHAENLILLTRNGGASPAPFLLFDRMLSSRMRSVKDPTGLLGRAEEEIINKNTDNPVYVYRNLVIGSTRDNLVLDMTHPYQKIQGYLSLQLILPSPLSLGQAFSTLNTLTVSNAAAVVTNSAPFSGWFGASTGLWNLGSHFGVNAPKGGGHLSILARGDLTNRDVLGTNGLWSGGSVNLSSTGTIRNGDGTEHGGITTGDMSFTPATHGGSIILKAGGDLLNMGNSTIESKSWIAANGQLMGGTLQFLVGRDLINQLDSYDVPHEGAWIQANAGMINSLNITQQAGVIDVLARRNIVNGLPNSGPLGTEEFRTAHFIADSKYNGSGGFIRLIAGSSFHNGGLIEAVGLQAEGTVITNP